MPKLQQKNKPSVRIFWIATAPLVPALVLPFVLAQTWPTIDQYIYIFFNLQRWYDDFLVETAEQ